MSSTLNSTHSLTLHIHRESKKNSMFNCSYLCQILTDFRNSFSLSDLADNLQQNDEILKFLSYLKGVPERILKIGQYLAKIQSFMDKC